jgi:hypothetical protein
MYLSTKEYLINASDIITLILSLKRDAIDYNFILNFVNSIKTECIINL